MVLNEHRDRVEPILVRVAQPFLRFHPNTLTMFSLIFAILAGIFLYLGWYILLPLVTLMIFLNSFFDALDGKVARLTGETSAAGDFLDHLVDRYADMFILVGIVLSSALCSSTEIGVLAIVGVLLTSYLGTQAQAVGCKRNYGGVLGRAERLVILTLAPLAQMIVYRVQYIQNNGAGWVRSFDPALYQLSVGSVAFTVFDIVLVLFAVLGNATAIHRALHSWRELRDRDAGS